MKRARLIQPVFACLTACMALAQQGAAPDPPPDEEDVPEEEEVDFLTGRAADPVLLEQLNRMLPVGGKAHEGLRYPIYGDRPEKGPPQREALFESKKVTRIAEMRVLFEGAVYKSYGDSKKPDEPTQTVSFKEAIYDVRNNLVSSQAPISVEDKGVKVNCGGVLHDLTTGLTVYTGGVELFFEDEPEEKKPAVPTPAASPADTGENPQPTPQLPHPPTQ